MLVKIGKAVVNINDVLFVSVRTPAQTDGTLMEMVIQFRNGEQVYLHTDRVEEVLKRLEDCSLRSAE
jgi:hypothetical protein